MKNYSATTSNYLKSNGLVMLKGFCYLRQPTIKIVPASPAPLNKHGMDRQGRSWSVV